MVDSHDVADWMIIGHLAQANAAHRQAVYNATTPEHRLAMDRAAGRWDTFWWYFLVVPCVIGLAVGVVLVMVLATPGVKLVVFAPLAAVCFALRTAVAKTEAKRSARRQAVTSNRQASTTSRPCGSTFNRPSPTTTEPMPATSTNTARRRPSNASAWNGRSCGSSSPSGPGSNTSEPSTPPAGWSSETSATEQLPAP